MGSWWRSEEMTYVSIILAESAAAACISEIGALGCMQFTDMTPELTPFQRRYVNNIKRCDELERKIRYVNGEIKKMNVGIQIAPSGALKSFVDRGTSEMQERSTNAFVLEELDGNLERYEQQLIELNKFGVKLAEEYNSKVEMHHVLTKVRNLFLGELHSMEAADRSNVDRVYQGRESSPGVSLHEVDEYRSLNSPAPELAFANIAGVMNAADRVRFERMLFRSTRGNCWVRFADIEDTDTIPGGDSFGVGLSGGLVPMDGHSLNGGESSQKMVFIIFYKSEAIQAKIRRICDAFSAHRYDLQSLDRPDDLRAQEVANGRELQDSRVVLQKNIDTRRKLCESAAVDIEQWLWIVRREKATYHTLNLFKTSSSSSNMLRGRGWIISSCSQQVSNALNRAHTDLNLPTSAILEVVPKRLWPTPPTHFNTNKYTDAFQEFVNTYGVPRYREANPALFTAATFPFLFGIMYGDIGHGSLLLLFGIFLILTESAGESRSAGEMVKGIYSARYMLFGMGLCAVYAGSVYNDYFSLGLDLFGSNYDYVDQEVGAEAEMISPYGDAAAVYPYGLDPAWKISDNSLLFFNSFKMKLSVVLGIVQMTWGIIIKGINAIYFNQMLDFYCEFIPMIIFDMAFFGYMVFLIFLKWTIDWDYRMGLGSCSYKDGVLGACQLVNVGDQCQDYNGVVCDATTPLSDMCPLGMGGTSGGCQPPNLITTLMNMALSPGTVDEPLYKGQATVQLFLLLVAFLCIPTLLCLKPWILSARHKAAMDEHHRLSSPLISRDLDEEDHDNTPLNPEALLEAKVLKHEHEGADLAGGHGHGEEFNFGEIVIHQAIETIEFVLGMVSNTASYLRLWALSLAHSELAEVFWDKALLGMIKSGNFVGIYIGFAVFAAVTFAVLLCMDVLECFLHALRLHWVEFQNKFYKADGHRFQPFDYKVILEKAVLE